MVKNEKLKFLLNCVVELKQNGNGQMYQLVPNYRNMNAR